MCSAVTPAAIAANSDLYISRYAELRQPCTDTESETFVDILDVYQAMNGGETIKYCSSFYRD
jgi:hypothetical protein